MRFSREFSILLSLFVYLSVATPYRRPIVRREWRTLPAEHQRAYLASFRCLHRLPSVYRSDPYLFSSGSRYEDFAAVHKLLTPYIHWESQFLPWHRHFLHVFEHALHTLCGYPKHLGIPYWDYTLDSADIKKSPIFRDSAFGGDGEHVKDVPGLPRNMPPGTGGGCITSGPFADKFWTVSLAPLNRTAPNPRCITRSINHRVAREACNKRTADSVLAERTFESMQKNMQGNVTYYTPETFGLHLCGHYVVAGPKAGADVYVGSLDPLFYVHHTNLDRIWDTWQRRNKKEGMKVAGRLRPELFRFPGARYKGIKGMGEKDEITLDWELDVGKLGPRRKVRDVMKVEDMGYAYA